MPTIEELLAQGIAAARAGQRDVARQHFQAVIRQDPRSETAWLWMSGLVDDPAQQRDCLQRVLAINPGNEHARRGLEKMGHSEAESFLSAFAPRTPPPAPAPAPAASAAGSITMPLNEAAALGPIPIDVPAQSAPPPAAPTGPVELPPVSKITEAPCVFCGVMTGVEATCQNCGMEQVFDCPECARVLDLREGLICKCGHAMRQYMVPGGMDRERLGKAYRNRDYPATAIKQWKAALPTSPKPGELHRLIAEVYMDLGLMEQARTHNELSKQQ